MLPKSFMTEQSTLTLQVLQQRLDALMLRDKQRFARRLHGVKKVKNPDAQQAIFQTMAKEIEQAASQVALREARAPQSLIRKICLLARRNRTFWKRSAIIRW